MSIDLFLKPTTDIFNIFIDVIFANKSHCIPKPNHRGHFQQEIRNQLQPELASASSHYYKDVMMMIIMVVLMMMMMFMVVLMTLMMMMIMMVKIIPLPVPWSVPV